MIYYLKRAVNISKGIDALERVEQFDSFAKFYGMPAFSYFVLMAFCMAVLVVLYLYRR